MLRTVGSLAGLLLLAGCATGLPVGARGGLAHARLRPAVPAASPRSLPGELSTPAARPPTPVRREEILARARELVGLSPGELARRGTAADCTSYVQGVFSPLGVDLLSAAAPGDTAIGAMYRFAQAHGRVFSGGRPQPGDLVFFRETYDRNRDGRANDGLTHVGIVDGEEPDGTVLVLHRVGSGVARYRMNLAQRDVRRDRTGRVLNDVLRVPGTASAEVLTGQLFVAFGAVLPSAAVATRK